MKKKFKCKIGFSDHSKDDRVAFAAVCLGAEVIEKHIALKNQKGFDIDFSLKGDEILRFRKNIDLASELVGKKFFFRSKIEEKVNILGDLFIQQKLFRKVKNLQKII